jgi:hypothetical protein
MNDANTTTTTLIVAPNDELLLRKISSDLLTRISYTCNYTLPTFLSYEMWKSVGLT